MEREDAHEMAVVSLVKMKAGQERVSLRDELASVSSHSRRKSAEHAFAGPERIIHHLLWQHPNAKLCWTLEEPGKKISIASLTLLCVPGGPAMTNGRLRLLMS